MGNRSVTGSATTITVSSGMRASTRAAKRLVSGRCTTKLVRSSKARTSRHGDEICRGQYRRHNASRGGEVRDAVLQGDEAEEAKHVGASQLIPGVLRTHREA